MSVSAFIPIRHRNDLASYLKLQGLVKGMILFSAIQFLVAISLLFLSSSITGHLINLSIAFYALISIYSLRYFKSLENYLNAVLGGYYLFIFVFTFINTEYLSDAIYWLGILLVVSVLFTKKRHVIFWLMMISLFIINLLLVNKLGMMFEVINNNPVYRILSFITFFVPLIIIVLIHSKYCDQNFFSQSRVIRRLQRKYVQNNEKIDELSHDLKSPADRILGLIQLLDRSKFSEDQLEIIELIKNTNDASRNMIKSILSKPDATCDGVEKFDLGHLVKGLMKTYSASLHDKNLRLNIVTDIGCYVSINRLKLIRILDNLVSNAIKYSRIGGDIKLTVKKTRRTTKITISDSGPGFSDLDMKLLFQRRMKLTAEPTANEQSYGLGLNIVNKLSNEIGCHIQLNESSKHGSTFEIIIPDN